MAEDGQAAATPAPAEAPRGSGRIRVAASVAVLVLIWAALQVSALWRIPFHSKGEPREAVAVQDFVVADRYVLPLRNGYEMPRKPPMFYWLGGIAALASGRLDEGITRLPSAVQSLGGAILVLGVGVAAGQPWTGFLSALVLLTSFEWMRSAVSARIDMTLAFGTTASFAGLYLARRHAGLLALSLLYGGMIWGTFAKGPIGIILPTLCLGAILSIDSGTRWIAPLLATSLVAVLAYAAGAPTTVLALVAGVAVCLILAFVALDELRPLRPVIGYGTVLVVTAAWYALATYSAGDEFFRTQVLAENFGRFLGTSDIEVGHRHGPGYLVGAVLAGLLPWTLFLPGVVGASRTSDAAPAAALRTHALVWIVVVFAFFSLSSSKRSVYLLPLYPAASVIIGSWLNSLWTRRDEQWWFWPWAQCIALFVATVGGAIATAFALHIAGLPIWPAVVDPILVAAAGTATAGAIANGFDVFAMSITCGAIIATIAAVGLYVSAGMRHPGATVTSLLATVIALQILVQGAILPAVTPASSREVFAARLQELAGIRPITVVPMFDYALAFYLGGAVPVYDSPDEPPPGAITVLTRDDWRTRSPRFRADHEIVPGFAAPKQGNQVPLVTIQRVAAPASDASEAEN